MIFKDTGLDEVTWRQYGCMCTLHSWAPLTFSSWIDELKISKGGWESEKLDLAV